MDKKEILKMKMELLKKQAELAQQMLPLQAKEDYATYVEFVHQGQYQHARHTRLICEKLQLIHEGKLKRLAIFMPPRHSKSMTVTETFPSWYIGKDPDRRVIQVSYNDDLACDFGLKNMQKAEEYGKALFGIDLDPDKQAKGDWAVKKHQGYMRSTGIASGITGKGANCFPFGTMVATEIGEIEISRLVAMRNKPLVLSYNHKNGIIELRPIIAVRESVANGLTEVELSSGNKIESTDEHCYYTEEQG